MRKEAAELKAQIEQTEASYLQAKSAHDRATSSLQAAKGHLVGLQEQFGSQRSAFLTHLRGAGFASYADYKAVLPQSERLEELQAALEKYEREYTETAAQKKALETEVAGRSPVDLEALEKRWKELALHLDALRASQQELYALIHASKQHHQELQELYRQSGTAGKRYTVLHDLASLAKGNQPPYVSFERYILAAYFDDIIQIANIHLQRMTGLRYRLKRKEERSSRTSGLDMEIIDSYTGKQRSVSTLSGGEGFKASLALALGLSDVVQMYAGGVCIDTMFIDEGFGSLDEKSLDSAMETLISLEKHGRMVGIISHVQGLGSHIPTRLVVRYGATGSTVQWEYA